jgi:steroid delta-isomerase-like uncharacterized protein
MVIADVVKTYVDAFSRADLDAWMGTFAPAGTYSDPSSPQPISGQALRETFAGFFSAFPDARCETVGLHAISEQVSVWRWIMRATNTGAYRGMPPTGRTITLPGCEFIEIGNNKIKRAEGYFDRLTLMAQLGLAPSPAPAAGS